VRGRRGRHPSIPHRTGGDRRGLQKDPEGDRRHGPGRR